jgi:putative hydrolase of the HAD superfamily
MERSVDLNRELFFKDPELQSAGEIREPVRAVTFDAAGTIIRLTTSLGERYAHWAGADNVEVNPEEIEMAFPRAHSVMFARRLAGGTARWDTSSDEDWWREVVSLSFILTGSSVPETPFQELFQSFAGKKAWGLYQDVPEALERLSSLGLPMGVISNFDERLLVILDELDISRYFDAVIISSKAGISKPDPGIFRLSAQKMGLDATEILHVGDSYSEDYLGAKQAGMKTLLLDRGRRFPIRHSIGDMRDMYNYLEAAEDVQDF